MIAALTAAVPLQAQFLARPHLEWRTLEVSRFSVYFPAALEPWARDVAAHMTGVDSVVSGLVGYRPTGRVRVVVDDPYNVSNGFAIPFLKRPVITFWATPPSPRSDIGNVRSWSEMLAVHEFAHVAHLARPSRNPLTRTLWALLPVQLGPVALRAPRWAVEGYATYVEGRVTGSGRPNNAWRAAILRQWALEGRLPTYAQLSAWSDFRGGEFAYLAGSAFLEWLAGRDRGDTSLVHVWRRLSARQTRGFDEAFAGVFGESPQTLYGRFTVELTTSAVAARRALASPGLAEGEMVQHLAWGTGDPGISGDGAHVAVVLRARDRPSRVVVWRTAPEPDTAAANAAERLLRRDPEDVPARRIHPPPKKPVATLVARAGRSFEDPRFMPDARRVLLWRHTMRGDGSLRPDLYLWTFGTGEVRRVTHGAAVREADPAPDGFSAAGIRCEHGRCDLVEVDLTDGTVRTLVEGSFAGGMRRPRVSPDGRTIAVSVLDRGRWRIALVEREQPSPRFVDPDDGANRYDAAWFDARSLVVVSERGGVMNLERLDPAARDARPLTRTTGAALAPEPNRTDGSVWFLALHSRGYDVKRLPSAAVATPVSLDPSLFPAAPPGSGARNAPPLPRGPVGPSRPFGIGGRRTLWLPLPEVGPDGAGAALSLSNQDIVGRLSLLAVGATGTDASWRGGAVRGAWRALRPEIAASGFVVRQEPSRAAGVRVAGTTLDAELRGGSLSAGVVRAGDVSRQELRAGVAGGDLRALPGSARARRTLGFARGESGFLQTVGVRTLREHVAVEGTVGELGDQRFARWHASLGVSLGGPGALPLAASVRYGRTNADAPVWERLTLGGLPSPVVADALLSQRVPLPTVPTGAAVGDELLLLSASLPSLVAPFYTAARVGNGGGQRWQRTYGLQLALAVPPIPVVGAPGAQLIAGVGRAIDDPFRGRTQGWIGMQVAP